MSIAHVDGADGRTIGLIKRANQDTLAKIGPVLAALRAQGALIEKSPGIFYAGRTAFAHFHDDASGIFADIKLDHLNYSRVRISTRVEQAALIRQIATAFAQHGRVAATRYTKRKVQH